MINETNLHPIRTSNCSNSVSSCHVMAYGSAFPLPAKKFIFKTETPQSYTSLVLEFSILHPTVLKMCNLPLTEDKKCESTGF